MSTALRFCGSLLARSATSASGSSSKLLSAAKTTSSSASRSLLPVITSATSTPNTTSTRSIVSLRNQDESFIRPAPFDYKRKSYTKLHLRFDFLDPTYLRMNPNSKVVVVEGNMGSEKAALAAKLADALGMKYFPEPRIEDYYINDQGFDYRTLNQYIHPKLAALDEKGFYENPKHEAVSWLKVFFYRQRYWQYIDAMIHLLSTGQGVVLERSPFSDFVFADAMYKTGWLPRDTYDYYYRLRYNTAHQLLRPHLIVYLDTDADVALKKIKERNIPYQVNSPVMTREYLQAIGDAYKEKYLLDAADYSELLVYKWNTPVEDIDDMVVDIEKLQMDDWDMEGTKFKDWNFYWNSHWAETRYNYVAGKLEMMGDFILTPIYDVDSLQFDLNDGEHRELVYESFVPNYGIDPSYNPDHVGFVRSLIGRKDKWASDNFYIRAPFY